MSYEFPADVRQAIDQQMSFGKYRSEDDVLRDALRALVEQRDSILEIDPVVVEGVRRGVADIEAGRSRPLSEFDAEFRAQHGIAKNA
jgi:Arc/MetJ-type ribon-helix-helix transcriptional regulator